MKTAILTVGTEILFGQVVNTNAAYLIEAPIPGKAAIGVEIENDKSTPVALREIVDSDNFRNAKSKISFAVGKDISGDAIVANLKDMPHMLIAGSTGSGKSVCINSILVSLLYKATPDEVKLILIDPKVVELSNYNGIPHLLIPVVTDPTKAAAALNWAVAEMEERYNKFHIEGAKDLASYNDLVKMNDEPDKVLRASLRRTIFPWLLHSSSSILKKMTDRRSSWTLTETRAWAYPSAV